MTEQHPITPPPELMQQWREQAPRFRDGGIARENWLMTRAAQWGADQELEACCEWVSEYVPYLPESEDKLRATRRPKPPSLKRLALARLALLERVIADMESAGLVPFLTQDDSIRLALEQLEPEGVTAEEIEREALDNADSDDEYSAFKRGAFFVKERISRPAIKQVPAPSREEDSNV